ncbi:hypothetical protein P0136_02730 [Lentisphaerota bacterium ZTH]|nr:hypothetical protein JYG24_06130 [Lentisphaerota bacterium]WET06917.1 hypothetical protein P0136_02730 [Lentisphaerota bacterium ZTH]
MKKILLAAVMLFAGVAMFANDLEHKQKPLDDWTFFQIGFWFDLPTCTADSNVYGLKTGQPISSGYGRVYGAEISWIAAATDDIKGAQGSWIFTKNRTIEGVQASFICNINKEEITGLQAGFVNICGNMLGFQPGAVCVSKDMNGIQAGVLTAYAKGTVTGAQFGMVNVCDQLDGFQASAFNKTKSSSGFQLGIINVSDKNGAQFGLVNIIKDGWIPFMPFFNCSFK